MTKTRKILLSALVASIIAALFSVGSDFISKNLQTDLSGLDVPILDDWRLGCSRDADPNNPSETAYMYGQYDNSAYCSTYGGTHDSHWAEVQKHAGIVVMYKSTLAGYGDYYMAGDYGFDTSPVSGTGIYNQSVVHCPDGATVQYHLRQHTVYSPTQTGMYDGQGHYWCEVGGVAVNPLPGSDSRGMPDNEEGAMMYKFTFPDGTSDGADYFKAHKIGGSINGISLGSDWVKCQYGTPVGPFLEGVNQVVPSIYESAENQARAKTPHYHCLDQSGTRFTDPILDSTGPAAPYNTYSFKSAIMYLTSLAGTGQKDVTGATAPCPRDTYYCQSTSANYRYCGSNPDCTGKFNAPAPSWTLNSPTDVRLNSPATSYESDDTIPFIANFQATGTWPSGGWVASTVKVSTSATNFSNPVWTSTTHTVANTLGQGIGGSYSGSGLSVGGPYYFCIQYSMWNDGAHTYDTDAVRDQTSSCAASIGSFTVIAPVVAPTPTCSLGLTLNDGKTTYSGNEFVNYTYTCSPDGTRAASVTVQVVNPSGTATTYNSATNIDTSTMGFSVSNLTAGNYILRACLSSTCTTGVTSVSFTVATTTPASTCDNDGTCEAINGETVATCSADCRTSTSATCGDGVCSSGETCAADCTPGGATATETARACGAGETCTAGSWCNNGKSCYFPNDGLTCVNWSQNCPAGTLLCSPTDTNCIEPGAYGPLSGWCTNAMECYSGNQKYCNPQSNSSTGMMTAASMTCPSGMKYCSPNDTNCIEPNGYGSLTGWCKNSMECYTESGTQKYCSPWGDSGDTVASMAARACPDGFKNCRPDDKNCIEVGETGASNGWCGGPAEQCFMPDGSLYCAPMDEGCPSNSGVCRADDQYCIEPNNYGSTNEWCGGRSVTCNIKGTFVSGKEKYCVKIEGSTSDPDAWNNVTCPSGYSRCPANDQYCLDEIGATGSSGSWCAVGMSFWNENGTVTCMAHDEFEAAQTQEVVETEEQVCVQVATLAYNPSNNKCKFYATSCNVPDGWKTLESGKVCENGVVVEIDVIGSDVVALSKIVTDDIQYLKGIRVQLKQLPSFAIGAAALIDLVDDTLGQLEKIRASLSTVTTVSQAIKDKLNDIHRQQIPDIETRMAALQPYLEFAAIEKDIRKDLESYKVELSRVEAGTEYYETLNDGIQKLEELLTVASSQTGQALEQIIIAIKKISGDLAVLVKEEHSAQTDTFLEDTINGFVDALDKFQKFVSDKNISDRKIGFMLKRFKEIVDELQNLQSDGTGQYAVSKLLDDASFVRSRIEDWLSGYGYTSEYAVSVEDILSHVEKTIADTIDVLFEKVANKFEIMVDEAIQNIAVRIAAMVDRVSDAVAARMTQSVSNLTYIPEEYKEEMAEKKDIVLEKLEDLHGAVEDSDLPPFEVQVVEDTIEVASTLNWCGDLAENVQSEINNVGLALELGDDVDVREFADNIDSYAAENNHECYREGVASFWDGPTNEWYFGPVEFNAANGLVRGYSDASGNPTGEFGPANSTLRIEALAMAMRMLDIPTQSGDSGRSDVPEWGDPYYNGAVNSGIIEPGWRWNEPITRLETAQLFYGSIRSLDVDYISEPTTYTAVDRYPDYSEFGNDPAVEALTDLGIFQGAGDSGEFGPYNHLLRSEFATVNQRIVDTFGLETVE